MSNCRNMYTPARIQATSATITSGRSFSSARTKERMRLTRRSGAQEQRPLGNDRVARFKAARNFHGAVGGVAECHVSADETVLRPALALADKHIRTVALAKHSRGRHENPLARRAQDAN